MTEDELKAIEERAEKATPGPWKVEHELNVSGRRGICTTGGYHSTGEDTYPENTANAAFIAHAREDIPALVAEVRRLRMQWIPIAEQEPPSYKMILISNDMYAGQGVYKKGHDPHEYYWYNEGEAYSITHWMPLPDPPEELR